MTGGDGCLPRGNVLMADPPGPVDDFISPPLPDARPHSMLGLLHTSSAWLPARLIRKYKERGIDLLHFLALV